MQVWVAAGGLVLDDDMALDVGTLFWRSTQGSTQAASVPPGSTRPGIKLGIRRALLFVNTQVNTLYLTLYCLQLQIRFIT